MLKRFMINIGMFLMAVVFPVLLSFFSLTVINTKSISVPAKIIEVEVADSGTSMYSGSLVVTYRYNLQGDTYVSKIHEYGTREVKVGDTENLLVKPDVPRCKFFILIKRTGGMIDAKMQY